MKVSRRTAFLLALAAVILALAAWAHGLRGGDMRVEVSHARRELAKAVGAVRLSEGRLTGGFAYARYASEGAPPKNFRRLKEARERIERALKREGSPQSFADAGVLNLLGGQLDRAVALLEQATKQDTADASIWSDLATVYLARHDKEGGFTDLLDALQAAERAVNANPNHPEARFNFALALDHLSLRWRARAAWSRYRDLDGHSEWSREAESRFTAFFQPSYSILWIERRAAYEQANQAEIGALARKLVQHFPQQAREMVEEDLLGRWAVQRSQHRLAEAEHTFALVKAIGTALTFSSGEHMIADEVRIIEVASADQGRPGSLDRLIAGHAQYQRGLEQIRLEEFQNAAKNFEAAGEALAFAGSPFESWARFRLAVCESQLFNYKSALKHLGEKLHLAKIDRYPAFKAKTLWVIGLIHGIRGNSAESLAAYQEAWESFERLGEQENRVLVSNLLAEAHRNLGDLPGAWKYHGLAVEGVRSIVNSARKRPILAELGVSLLTNDRPRLSIYVQEELLRGYVGSLSPGSRVGGLRRMAEAQHHRGNYAKAISLIDLAERELAYVPEPKVREALRGDLLALEGEAEANVSPRRGIRLLTEAIVSCEKSEYRQPLVRLLLKRARALRRERDFGPAEASLRQAIELIGDYKPAENLIAPSFEEVRQVFQEMSFVQVLQGRPKTALEFAEKARAQLLSLMASTEAPAIPLFALDQIQEELPSGVALIEWWIGEREIFIWTVRHDSVGFTSKPIDVKRLGHMVRRFRQAIASDDTTVAGLTAARLYEILISPIAPRLKGAERLVLIPDSMLSSLPFAALQSSSTSPYLIEEFILSVSPSASLYLHSFRRQRELAVIDLSVVAFGDPFFDRTLFRDLRSLPHSEAEAEQIVNVYSRGKIFLGSSATRSRLLNEMVNWSVLHIGGHAVADPANPFASVLALAPSREDTGIFYFRDLAMLRLKGMRLAVFSACSTLSGESGAGAEIAVPLLAQGVPSVVGTLWPVADRSVAALTVELHHRFVQGRDAAKALREVQLMLLRDSRPGDARPSLWAAFELVGSQ